MKKFLLILPLLAVTFLSFAKAPGTEPITEQAFRKQFAGAEDIKWTKAKGDYQKVSFVWNGHRTEAFFNENAELIGSARMIFFDQLPMSVARGIKKNFPNGTAVQIAEIFIDEVTSYNTLIEQGDKKFIVRFDEYGQVVEKEKVK
jgi:bisphosphoglycerate-independent phosphoglycerate mutase (AlkP superfamily)